MWPYRHDDCPNCKPLINKSDISDEHPIRRNQVNANTPQQPALINEIFQANNNGFRNPNTDISLQFAGNKSDDIKKKDLIDLLMVESWVIRTVLSTTKTKPQHSLRPWVFCWSEEALKNIPSQIYQSCSKFKELSIERLFAIFPQTDKIWKYLPGHLPLVKFGRTYTLNVA